jgi:hypothetical protein
MSVQPNPNRDPNPLPTFNAGCNSRPPTCVPPPSALSAFVAVPASVRIALPVFPGRNIPAMSSMAASKDAAFPCTCPRNWFPKSSAG